MKMKVVHPECNLATLRDGRGAIFSFVPDAPILEWTHQFIYRGSLRGNHCHPEFDEYILLVGGEGVEIEKDIVSGEEHFIYMSHGNCIFIPRGVYHVFRAITDAESVSFLTKPWNECKAPIVHENLGHGAGDFGDPGSRFHGERNRSSLHGG